MAVLLLLWLLMLFKILSFEERDSTALYFYNGDDLKGPVALHSLERSLTDSIPKP
jgi:hypothetical protein